MQVGVMSAEMTPKSVLSAGKAIQRHQLQSGRKAVMKFMKQNPSLASSLKDVCESGLLSAASDPSERPFSRGVTYIHQVKKP